MNPALPLWLLGTSVLLTVSCMGVQRTVGRRSSLSGSFKMQCASSSSTDGSEIGISSERRRRRTFGGVHRDVKEVLRRRRVREESASAPMNGRTEMQTEMKMKKITKITAAMGSNTSTSLDATHEPFVLTSNSRSETPVPISKYEEENVTIPRSTQRNKRKINKFVYGVGYNDANYSVFEKTLNTDSRKWVVTWVSNYAILCIPVSSSFTASSYHNTKRYSLLDLSILYKVGTNT